MSGVDHAEHPEFDDDQRLHLQAQCRSRLEELSAPFLVSSPVDSWRPDPTPLDAEHGRWEQASRHDQLMPSLIDQLRMVAMFRRGASTAKGTWESRPTAPLDAIDAVQRINAEAEEFVTTRLHATSKGLDEDLKLIARRVPTLTDDDLAKLVKAVRSWWVTARVWSGLEDPPVTPHAPCPLCDAQDSIDARPDADLEKFSMARCRKCGETWDASTIGLLAESIKAAPPRPPRSQAPSFHWVFVGNRSQARRWAIANGVEPTDVYAAADGPFPLEGIRGPVNLVLPPDRSKHYADSLANMAAVVHLVRQANAVLER